MSKAKSDNQPDHHGEEPASGHVDDDEDVRRRLGEEGAGDGGGEGGGGLQREGQSRQWVIKVIKQDSL